jgi:hypothetical protein
MRHTLLAALALTILCACSSPSREREPSLASPTDDAAIRGSFDAYCKALLAGDGEAALAAVDRNTIEYYQRMLDLARHGDEPTVRALSVLNKVMVLSLRHRLPREQVLTATPESAFIHAVNEGWIGKDGVIKLELGTIRVRDAVATAAIQLEGKDAPLSFTFHKEASGWKVDLTSVMTVAGLYLKPMLPTIAPTEDEAVVVILESVSGTKVPPQVWQPLQPTP